MTCETWEYQLAGTRASSLCPSRADLERDGWEVAGKDLRYSSVWMRRPCRRLNAGPVLRTKARRTAIRNAREARGLTRPAAAALARISESYLAKLESGKRRVTFAVRSRLLAAWDGVPVLPPAVVSHEIAVRVVVPEEDVPMHLWGRKTA